MSLLERLQEEFPLLASSLHTKLDDETAIELVLRERLTCPLNEILRCLETLGAAQVFPLTSVFLYKDFVSKMSEAEQVLFYETLGRCLGPQLDEFSLSFVKLPVASLANLLENMPRLKKLYLGRVSLLQKQGAAQLYATLQSGCLSQLDDFHCYLAPALTAHDALFHDNNDTLDDFFHSVAALPSLRTFYLAAVTGRGHIQTTECLRALSHSTIQDLTLMNCPLLTSQHVQALLHKRNAFSCLSLINARMGDLGAAVILQKENLQGLQKLYLPGNNLTDRTGTALAQALTPNQSLKVLDLHDNRLTSQFGLAFAPTLQHTQLQFLDLSYNPLGDAGGIALATALTHNTTLQQLHLFQNQISDQTCMALATALNSNRTLKQINLYHNPQIQTVQTVLLHNLEHHNYVLERLEIENNNNSTALEFWLKLNRNFGRQGLLSGDDNNDAVYLEKGLAQASQANDLNSLFYFLKHKPTLCHAGAANTSSLSRRRKRLSKVTAQVCHLLSAQELGV